MSIALAIIAKDETEQLKRIIKDYGKYFDEIAIAIDDVDCLKEIDAYGGHKNRKLLKYDWIDDFADKRNKLSEIIESEYYIRIDTDDVILNAEELPSVIEKVYQTIPDVIYCKYIYSRDSDGNVIAEHWRETIIRKSNNCYWEKKVHENIFIKDQSKFRGAKDSTLKILHMTEPGHSERSFDRNMKILVDEYNEDKENTDPRTIAYLGRMMMGKGEWAQAISLLQLLIKKSGWNDDKYYAYAELGFCHLQLGETDQAIAACFEAMNLNPEFPDAYICLGEIYLENKEFEKAKAWLLQANVKKMPNTMYVIDPSRYSVRLAVDIAMAYFGCGEFENANLFFSRAKQIAPNNSFVKENETLFRDGFEQDKYIRNLLWMFHYVRENDFHKIKTLVESIPKNMLCDERIQKIRHQILPPKKWDENSIVIFCGQSWEEWAAPSVHMGLGGSEEAVVYLSKELVKLGYKVTVFNGCGDMEGEYDGVSYLPFYYFNPNDNFDILIGWRGNIFKSMKFHAKKTYVWMHDVPSQDQFDEESMDNIDKLIVQSKYHRSLFPDWIGDDKFLIARNGINLENFKVDGRLRNPKRMMYASSYDRGIQHLLLRWPEVKAAVPDAELHIFYGWDVYDQMLKKGFRDAEFKNKMIQLMKQDGVFEHGRVGHHRLNQEFQESGLWVYPCHFEEISAIAAMKAQANGAVPAVVKYAALNETVKSGWSVEGKATDKETMDKYIIGLIELLKDSDRQEELRRDVIKHKDEFGWDGVAAIWHKEFQS